MLTLGRTSIRKKLMLVLLLTSSSALVISAVGFMVSDWFSQQESMVERLRAVAGIIGTNSVAALTFEDFISAQKTLSILKEEDDIVSASLFTEQGILFASYQRNADASPVPLPEKTDGYIGDAPYVVVPVTLEDAVIGSILLISDQSYWKQRQLFHLIIALGVLLLSLVVALIISSRLQRVVSEPIIKLAKTATLITVGNDYSLRAKKISTDEIGRLVDDFNAMLDQIQIKDDELRKAKEQLENKGSVRTQERTELTKQLEHQAYHCTLTGLANRVNFDNNLQLAIEQSQRYDRQLAVLFLDLDRFKNVNDTLGHAVGDSLLIEVAERFSTCLRASDTFARLGGDELAVLRMDIDGSGDAADVAQKLRTVISESIEVDGFSLHPSTSIGISLFPDDGDSAKMILKHADTAMYRSKDNGRNQITFFSPEMNVRASRRLELENKLRQVIQDQSLQVHYQPRCDAASLKIIGVEALVRWNHPERGLLLPEQFIPLAEETGLIIPLGRWVLHQACSQATRWPAGTVVSVNLSPLQLHDDRLLDEIAHALGENGLPGERRELEVTESTLM